MLQELAPNSLLVENFPKAWQALWPQRLESFCQRAPEQIATKIQAGIAAKEGLLAELPGIWCASDYIASSCSCAPEMLVQLLDSGELEKTLCREEFAAVLDNIIAEKVQSEADLGRELRHFRRYHMTRIIWRDFSRRAPMEETTRDMSWLAEVVLDKTIDYLYEMLAATWGYPQNKTGERQHLVVLGMGKLGAWELNVSSDIDLIFAYPESGYTEGGRRQSSNQEFFIRLGQRLIKLLDEHTADGFVFRMDMRLRPYGQSGPLVMNFDSMEEYFQTQGRNWERYAMVKARPVAGDLQAGSQLMEMLRPFTYRRYIDFSAIEALREMKVMINREVMRSGTSLDVKKGQGGIREVEFIVQAFQIIRGGRDRRLQITPIKEVLPLLEELQLLPSSACTGLYQAYVFLRNMEHAIQGWNDQQTQIFPSREDEQLRIARVMGFTDIDALMTSWEQHRQFVREVFSEVVAEAEDENVLDNGREGLQQAIMVWREPEQPQYADELVRLGFDDVEAMQSALVELKSSRTVRVMPDETRARLDKFIPLLLLTCGEDKSACSTFKRLLPFVNGILRRSAYLVLLNENQQALERLVTLFSASPWIASQLTRHPALLDELLDSRSLYSLPDKQALIDELRQLLLRIPEEDLEAQMEAVRYFKLAHSLKVAACEVTGQLPLMKVSDYLSWLAETILTHVMAVAWSQMVDKYGEPGCKEGGSPGIAVIGYGKLGGIELGHGSDLDLVFIHNAETGLYTQGEKSVDNATFFTRIGQRIIHILTAQTPSGDVYEVDMRLRPSGNSGLLVSHIAAFEKYQLADAWTWEHQALVRARPIAGSPLLIAAFQQVRAAVLCQERSQPQLVEDVLSMREKMKEHLGSKGTEKQQGQFHIKQDAGGIVDIEFLVQYHVLLNGLRYPELLEYTDNIRVLDAMVSAGLLPVESADQLKEAYVAYRSLGHRLNLNEQSNLVPVESVDNYRQQVLAVWESVFC